MIGPVSVAGHAVTTPSRCAPTAPHSDNASMTGPSLSAPVVARLSIILPARNEAANVVATLSPLQPLRARGVEVILVDGGSTDETPALATPLCDRVIASAPGRAQQMNAGAAAATGDTLLFLHADTRLPADADTLILQGLACTGQRWGRFDVHIEGRHPLLPMVAWFMNHRSRLTGIATGDQGLFVTRADFEAVGGYANIRLMEDIRLCAALKLHCGRPLCIPQRIITSGRRWDANGLWRTIALMWWLRLRHFLGASPDQLHAIYYGRKV